VLQENNSAHVQKQAAILQHKLLQNLRQAIIEKHVKESFDFTMDAIDLLSPSGTIVDRTERACIFFIESCKRVDPHPDLVNFDDLKEMASSKVSLKVYYGEMQLSLRTSVFVTHNNGVRAQALVLPHDIRSTFPAMYLAHLNTLVYTIEIDRDMCLVDIQPC